MAGEGCACSAPCSSRSMGPVQQRPWDQGDCCRKAACALREGCSVRCHHRSRYGALRPQHYFRSTALGPADRQCMAVHGMPVCAEVASRGWLTSIVFLQCIRCRSVSVRSPHVAASQYQRVRGGTITVMTQSSHSASGVSSVSERSSTSSGRP